jgi:hypothetical protein
MAKVVKEKHYEVPREVERFVKEMPEHIKALADAKGRVKAMSIKCGMALLAKPSNFGLVFTLEEFSKEFNAPIPRKIFGAVRKYMAGAGVAKPKVVQDQDRIYITRGFGG